MSLKGVLLPRRTEDFGQRVKSLLTDLVGHSSLAPSSLQRGFEGCLRVARTVLTARGCCIVRSSCCGPTSVCLSLVAVMTNVHKSDARHIGQQAPARGPITQLEFSSVEVLRPKLAKRLRTNMELADLYKGTASLRPCDRGKDFIFGLCLVAAPKPEACSSPAGAVWACVLHTSRCSHREACCTPAAARGSAASSSVCRIPCKQLGGQRQLSSDELVDRLNGAQVGVNSLITFSAHPNVANAMHATGPRVPLEETKLYKRLPPYRLCMSTPRTLRLCCSLSPFPEGRAYICYLPMTPHCESCYGHTGKQLCLSMIGSSDCRCIN